MKLQYIHLVDETGIEAAHAEVIRKFLTQFPLSLPSLHQVSPTQMQSPFRSQLWQQ
jgi:hypothetical protein